MGQLQDRAGQLLDANAKRGDGYYYVSPSNRKYPHQWSWDSSFHAIVNCRLGRVDRAAEEVLTLLSNMSPDGHLPHIVFHDPGLASPLLRAFRRYWPQGGRSPLVQPPVVALAVREIWESGGDASFLREAVPLVERHFDWLAERRRFGGSHLLSIFSPWECGLDHKPAFDRLVGRLARLPLGLYIALYTSEWRMSRHGFDPGEIARRGSFNVREVLFNTVYALGLEALASMLEAAGDGSKAERSRRRAEDVERAILDECYDPTSGLYFDIDVPSGSQVREPSVSCLMPLALGGITEERREALLRHLTDAGEFWPRYPIPSLPLSSRHFRPSSRRYLWRGPTWINTNWLVWGGLRRHGYADLADAVARGSRDLAQRSGFWEYYNPLTGEGGGAKEFGWSTLAAIM
jgi:glycogen debranching enzyme